MSDSSFHQYYICQRMRSCICLVMRWCMRSAVTHCLSTVYTRICYLVGMSALNFSLLPKLACYSHLTCTPNLSLSNLLCLYPLILPNLNFVRCFTTAYCTYVTCNTTNSAAARAVAAALSRYTLQTRWPPRHAVYTSSYTIVTCHCNCQCQMKLTNVTSAA